MKKSKDSKKFRILLCQPTKTENASYKISNIIRMKSKKPFESRVVKIGVVGVDSGQLIISDPSYIESEFISPEPDGNSDHAHSIYQHEDGTYWQYCYEGEKPSYDYVRPLPGSYAETIKEYDATPNDLIEQEKFKKTKLDPTPHIPKGEFSYRGICKTTKNQNQAGQLNYKLGHEGVAVVFSSGLGDGTYEVFAEIVNAGDWGERIKRVYIELLTDEEIEEMQSDFFADRN